MKKLDRYILKSFIGPFFAILTVVLFIFMLDFLWIYIDELVGKGLGLKVIFEFLKWGICTFLPITLPLATLLASMMIVGSMAENKELMALKASGVSLARIMAPLTAASFMIAVGAFFVSDLLVPKAYNEIFTLRDDISKTNDKIKIPSGTFYDGIEGYVLNVGEQDKETGMMRNVMVYDHSGDKGNTALTIADSSILGMSPSKDYLIFTMFHGCNYQENNVRKYRDTTNELQTIRFSRQELVIPLKNYSFEKSDSTRFGDQVKSMNMNQLVDYHDSLTTMSAESCADHYRQFVAPFCFTMRNQLDSGFVSGSKTLFQKDNFCKWSCPAEERDALDRAIDRAQSLSSEVVVTGRDAYEQNFYLRHTDVCLLKMFASALACFILFFIGAPLGALIKKGGLGTSAIISVLFFVLYWVVDISGTKLANDGTIRASSGVFISSFVLAPIGAFLTWKAINDSELFDMDGIKNWCRMVIGRIRRIVRPVRIVYMGTPEFAVAPLDALLQAGHNVVGVVTVADKPSGRGLKVNESAVKQYAVEHGLPVLQPLKLKDPEFLNALKAWKADLFVVVAFRMLPEEVWSMPRMGTFNLHAALLPQYRGAAPINWAVINGEKLSGVTTFMIDKNMDTGGILLREECRIGPEDTAGDLHDRLMEMGAGAVLQTVNGLIEKSMEIRVQRSFIQGSEVLKPAPKLTRELCHIDWNDTSERIYNLIRGLSPYPAAYTELVKDDQRLTLKIYKASRSDLRGTPGQILTDGKTYLSVATSDGALNLLDIQLSGKKRMDVASFLLGFREAQTWKIET